ncbi:hypothetical protein BKK79_03945 [Cupriavidus sp. USMAA2-4]|uniref:Uncharacterized protein n=1 Tax=Cupriavidus malaysiensis TaxID=367825 RepID=A0ABM6F3K9_9BURK|nr:MULTISPECIES: hypothetical protein [Cupriavidus]AOY91060.1 hypothetical protein BKK79_03945 [Cupriavidus sp. USMAA2-4]AOY99365.1 hypothetical protein BKK81_08885 [Cupriavidus sp. USMAHM13]AOZ05982.1 hypothetical protein BKK80_09170 [Cupriavidus malaysiensis]
MQERTHRYKGFTIRLAVPDAIGVGDGHGWVRITGPDESVGVRFTPDWMQLPITIREIEACLLAYATGLIDSELAGGFGVDLEVG